MVDERKKKRSPLLPDRLESEIFLCDPFDVALKGDVASMEHPIFSISTKPDTRVKRYEHDGKFIEITPSVKGLATVHDRDILLYCISQLVHGINEGKKASKTVRFVAHDLLKATQRRDGGEAYKRLKEALERLRGTTITTNITTGGEEQTKIFGVIESAEIIRETRDGRMQEVEVVLPDWVFNSIEAQEVLTLHRDYYRLRKPLERRLYEIARKHCGYQKEWKISLELLKKKCASKSRLKEFKRLILKIVKDDTENGHMPDYAVRFEESKERNKPDMVIFHNRGNLAPAPLPFGTSHSSPSPLSPETYDRARSVAPGYDVYELEHQWREWSSMLPEPPRKPDEAFIGFCKKVFNKRGPVL